MNAWFITWEWGGDHAKASESLVAILSSRKSAHSIAELVELLYLRATATAAELAYYANRRKRLPYSARQDQNRRITCGHNPWLCARVVTDLTVDSNIPHGEVLQWREPDTYGLDDNDRIVIKRKGVQKRMTRFPAAPVGNDLSGKRPGVLQK
jgi:hypothetical protein